jgi:hypothetical protein
MAFNNNITPGAPPLLWSNIHDAFTQINNNFDILVATVGDGSGLIPIDFNSLDTNVSPNVDNEYTLGSLTKSWASIYSSEYTTIPGNENNGVWLGTAQIKGIGGRVELPFGSTVNGNLIIDPNKTFFKEIQVNNNLSIVATQFSDSFNLISGDGIGLNVNSSSDSIEIENTGILSVIADAGISVTTISGNTTIANTGVRSLTSTTALPSGRSAGTGINIDSSTGAGIKITNTGVISIVNGVGITVSTDAASGEVQITNSAPAVNAFTQIEVNGDFPNRLLADAVSDVLNINSGQGITLTKNTVTDTLTITVDPRFDLKGSIFGDDSTKIVDAVENKVFGGIFATTLRTADLEISLGDNTGSNQGLRAVAVGALAGSEDQGIRAVSIGNQAGQYRQGARGVAIGPSSGFFEQGDSAVAIGDNAGQSSQGDYAIAVGYYAGHNNQSANSIILNASSAILNGPSAAFYVNPVRNQTGASGVVQYDSTTKEVSYSSALGSVSGTFTGNIFTSLIDSADSSAITVTPITIFSSDVVVENDLNVTQRFLLRGSRVLNLTDLKAVVAASTDFADFKTRIAALV